MNNRELCKMFGSDENQKMLFSILEESNIDLNNDDIMSSIENIYEQLMEIIMNNTKVITLMEINKRFIRDVIKESKLYYNNDFYKNKIERRKEKRDEIENRIHMHKENFKSFEKKLPEQIDFSDKNWKDKIDISSKIELRIKERDNELKRITNSYEKETEFRDHKKWQNKNKLKSKNNLKIMNESVNIEPIQIKSEKRVHFEDENETLKKKLKFLEDEVSEIKRLIREVLSEKIMKKTTSKS
jgi:hypothetical protein